MSTFQSLRCLGAGPFAVAWALGLFACGSEQPGGAADGGGSTLTYHEPGAPGYASTSGTCRHDFSFNRTAKLEEKTSLGFSASDVIARFNENAHGTVVWADGATARIDFSLSTTSREVRYDASPTGQGLCVPSMFLDGVALTVKTSDGLLEQTFTGERAAAFALADGKQGIALIGFFRIFVGPDVIVSPLVDAAAAVHPEHDERAIWLDFDQSDTGVKGSCLDGAPISDDPLEDCNRYAGTIAYQSNPSDWDADIHHIHGELLFQRALGTWTWD